MLGQEPAGGLDDQLIERIAVRVADMLQDNLEALAAELATTPAAQQQLTVKQVAQRLGVTRSTVYAHWREWGGYKLGTGPKAPVRFDSAALPVTTRPTPAPQLPDTADAPSRPRRRRAHRTLLADAPRLIPPLNAGS